MSEFVVLTHAKTNRRLAMNFSDKKITTVSESCLKETGQNCVVIGYKQIKSKNSLISLPEFGEEEIFRVKEPFDEVLKELGIAGDDK